MFREASIRWLGGGVFPKDVNALKRWLKTQRVDDEGWWGLPGALKEAFDAEDF